MTYYSYPFNNLDINEFWDCFDNLENIDIMDIKSNTLINGKFSKAKCYLQSRNTCKRMERYRTN